MNDGGSGSTVTFGPVSNRPVIPKGTSIHKEIFDHFVELKIPSKLVGIIGDQEKPVSFKFLLGLLDLCLPCADSMTDHDMQASWLIEFKDAIWAWAKNGKNIVKCYEQFTPDTFEQFCTQMKKILPKLLKEAEGRGEAYRLNLELGDALMAPGPILQRITGLNEIEKWAKKICKKTILNISKD